jgi:RimJ/RimL family protein N-acetyltransferase
MREANDFKGRTFEKWGYAMSSERYTWKGEHVTLRSIKEKDAPAIVKWRNDPAVYCFFKVPQKITLEKHLEWYRTSYLRDENRIDFIVELEEAKQAGTAGIIWRQEKRQAEISYLIGQEHRRQGVAAQALKTLCQHAPLLWPVKSFAAIIHQDNIPSQKFILAQGFVLYNKEGTFLNFTKEVSAL